MTDELVEPGPDRQMNEIEQTLAKNVYNAIQEFSRRDERGMQTLDGRVGISDLGFCPERTRRMLNQEEADDTDVLQAFIGTALGDFIEQACVKQWPTAIAQATVTCPLQGDGATYHITGHPDLILPEGLLIDFKTTRGLEVPRRTGPKTQQQYQRHCYAKGAWLGGFFNPDVTLADVQVANVWMDRGGDEKQLFAHVEPYSEEVVTQATWWLDEAVYAYVQKTPARKEPPYEVCERYCGFFRDCRLGETDAEGLLTDDDVLAAVAMHREAAELEKRAKMLKDQAKAHLEGVTGSTGEFAVRWVHVNGSHVEFDRKSYERLDIRKVK